MKLAVILSTYNAPDRLEPTLIGYSAQTHPDFELIVADDGSTDESRQLIEAVAARYSMPIKHVWHEDLGFRKCRILNQAILATHADYLIFSDGDCVPRCDFVAEHAMRARPRHFLSGGYFKLNAQASGEITAKRILDGCFIDPSWLASVGMARTGKLRRLALTRWHANLMNRLTPTRPTWNGHNASGWRTDLLSVNGFDERMAYWAQDREFGERLGHAGISGLQIRYSAVCVHLHHERPYKTEGSRERNLQIRRETRTAKSTWTPHGVVKGTRGREPSVSPTLAGDVRVQGFRTT